eukprot:TRINITY_DN5732_c0_g1_i2.p1 TRINITY_DN5732_c0_g1~~TRINITY_DN5732_c0_g1_i2.p1  ORF type:complete len:566 (-),score=104.78 TRINITY_DN5732_c0_g1_i2:138-1835(-)
MCIRDSRYYMPRSDTTVSSNFSQLLPAAPETASPGQASAMSATVSFSAPSSGTYHLSTTARDGVMVTIGDHLVVNAPGHFSECTAHGSIALQAGQNYTMRVKYLYAALSNRPKSLRISISVQANGASLWPCDPVCSTECKRADNSSCTEFCSNQTCTSDTEAQLDCRNCASGASVPLNSTTLFELDPTRIWLHPWLSAHSLGTGAGERASVGPGCGGGFRVGLAGGDGSQSRSELELMTVNKNGQYYWAPPIKGRLARVANPVGHFSVLPPAAGCGVRARTSATAAQLAQGHRCEVAVNGGFFDTRTGDCHGAIVSRGSVVQDSAHHNARFGVTKGGRFVVGYFNISDFELQDVVTGVQWIVRDGQEWVQQSSLEEDMSIQESGQSFSTLVSARTAIGHTADGALLLLTISGQSWRDGVDLPTMAGLMVDAGAVQAINLDGGGSATFVVNGTVANDVSDQCVNSSNPMFRCERAVTTIACVHDTIHRSCFNASTTTGSGSWGAACSGHGRCTEQGRCECAQGYEGDLCSKLHHTGTVIMTSTPTSAPTSAPVSYTHLTLPTKRIV